LPCWETTYSLSLTISNRRTPSLGGWWAFGRSREFRSDGLQARNDHKWRGLWLWVGGKIVAVFVTGEEEEEREEVDVDVDEEEVEEEEEEVKEDEVEKCIFDFKEFNLVDDVDVDADNAWKWGGGEEEEEEEKEDEEGGGGISKQCTTPSLIPAKISPPIDFKHHTCALVWSTFWGRRRTCCCCCCWWWWCCEDEENAPPLPPPLTDVEVFRSCRSCWTPRACESSIVECSSCCR